MKKGIIAGSFDLIHPGYIRMFKESKQHCDYLIIALQGDPTIERITKCKPVHALEERIEILASIRYIDEIATYNIETDLYELLKNTEYDLRILGVEYKEKNYTGKDLGKEVLWLERAHNYSTTNLKEKIYKERQEFKQKL
jgi:glycerol-3-phosphate cytidylyltransferase